MFDCIIVGAGLVGGTAAYHLARRGRSVLVLEKDSLPRYKPCGGGVSPAIQAWFDEVGIQDGERRNDELKILGSIVYYSLLPNPSF